MPKEKRRCAYCLKTVINLKPHTKKLHPDQTPLELLIDKQQKCPHCSLSLSHIKKDSFLNHVRVCYLNPSRIFRSGGPFVCPYCTEVERKFSRKQNLTKHLKLKHSPTQQTNDEPSERESSIGTPQLTQHIYDLINGQLDPKLLIDLNRIEEQSVERLRLRGSRKGFRFTPLCRELASYGFFVECISTAFKYLIETEGIRENYLLSISLESPSELEYPIPLPVMRGKDFKVEDLLDRIEMVIQSHSKLGLHSDLLLNVVAMPDPLEGKQEGSFVGARLNPRKFARLEEYLKRKSGILDPTDLQPEENICLPLCIAFHVATPNPKQFRKIKMKIAKAKKIPPRLISIIQTLYNDVLKLEYNSKIEISTKVFDQLQYWMGENYHHRLTVYRLSTDKISESEILYPGNAAYAVTTPLLIYHSHCYLITNEKLFFGRKPKTFCRRCCQIHPRDGFCDLRCRLCTSQSCANLYQHCDGLRTMECKDCSRHFKNEYCFEMHQSLNVCQILSKCNTCQKTMKRNKLSDHACLLHKCRNCSLLVDSDHKCFILPVIKKLPSKGNKPQVYIFFDIESIQHDDGRHELNVFVLYRCCELCIDDLENMEPLCCHGNRRHKFVGTDCVTQAIEFMFFHPDNKDAIAIAHFGSGYDFNFILRSLLNLGHRPHKIYCRNLRILTLVAGNNVSLKDSYLWFGCKLRKLSDLWSLPVRKCYFNHSWNTPEKLKYEGPWPSPEEFQVPTQDNDGFDVWYVTSRLERPVYNRLNELVGYCELRISCQKFRSLVLEFENVDPFRVSISIASLTAYTYQKNYLLPETLPLILDKDCGAIGLRQQSKIALKYLSWLVKTKYPNLKYAGNGPERRIANYTVDGFDVATNKVIEVFGDCIHACPKHTSSSMPHPLKPHLSNGDVLDNSMAKIFYLRKQNYSVEVVWECEIVEMLQKNLAMKKWFDDRERWNDLSEPIGARDALHGGRVEAFVLLLELTPEMIEAGWRINNLDVVSLYPHVQSDPKYFYPTSHPIIINGCQLENEGSYPDWEEIEKFFGLISCSCYAPTDLLIPVLPVKHEDSGRLVFPLCGRCSYLANNNTDCEHRGEERSFQGCWTTPELSRAVKLGYKIVKVNQIWHFERKSNSLFRDYIYSWIRLKFAASGWPEECQSLAEKEEFLLKLHRAYGIKLDLEDVKENIPLRTLCKHFLNNLWGKLSTRLDRMGCNVQFIASEQELCGILSDPKQELIAFSAITDCFAILETLTKDQFVFSPFHNPVIASFVTAYGRLTLLDHLSRPRPNRIIYTDTDSIVYLTNVNESDPYQDERGNLLGMLKNELDSPDDFIIRWVSLGSKNYSYETSAGRVVHRSKGLIVRDSVSSQYNFDLLRAVLLKDSKTIKDFYDNLPNQDLSLRLQKELCQKFPNQIGVLLPQPMITRNFKKNEDVITKPTTTKFLRFCFTKRKLVDNMLQQRVADNDLPPCVRLRSIPWGFE